MIRFITQYKYGIYLVCTLMYMICSSELYAQEDPKQVKGLAREYYQEGVFYGKQGKYIEAVMALEKAIELYPAYTEAYNALGVVYHRQKDYPKAVEHYLVAIESEPAQAKARTNLAMIYNEQNAYQKALHQLEKALQTHPEYKPAQRLIVSTRKKVEEQNAKELARQQKAAEQASAIASTASTALTAPTAPTASTASTAPTVPAAPAAPTEQKRKVPQKPASPLFHTATQLMQEGFLDAAIRSYYKGLERLPRSAEGYNLLGMAYREKFRTCCNFQWRRQEIAAFATALKFQPKYVPALLGLGEIFYEYREYNKALYYFKQALTFQPKHPARDQLEEVIHRLQ